MSASVITDSRDLLGKTADDLQENVSISDSNVISGTLHHIENWTEFDSNPSINTGNFIALHFETNNIPGSSISVTVTNPVTLDADGDVILRIADKDSQTITVVASADGYESVTEVYTLTGLTLESE